VALAFSLPHGPERDALVTITYYGIMTFSILVQGLTVGKLVRQFMVTAKQEDLHSTSESARESEQ